MPHILIRLSRKPIPKHTDLIRREKPLENKLKSFGGNEMKWKKHKFCKPFKLKIHKLFTCRTYRTQRQCETASTTGRGIWAFGAYVRRLRVSSEPLLLNEFWDRKRKWNFVDAATDAWLKFSFSVFLFLLTDAETPISNGLLKLKLIDRATITKAVFGAGLM